MKTNDLPHLRAPHHPTKSSRFGRWFCGASLLIAGYSSLSAQSSTEQDTDVIQLTPFQVQAELDEGFVAATSLAGGRLKGDLKDTPVAYSVLTRDFIDALGLTDLEEMTAWLPNTTQPTEAGELEWSRNDFYLSSRGITANKPQRDFFPYGFNFDSYNIERLDFGRGPNSILFGNSGYGSTANILSKRARTDKTFTKIQASYGSWDKFRSTIDHNQKLNDNFAVRVNGLYLDRDGWMDNDFEKREAATVAMTWWPAKNTEVRVEAEIGSKEKAAVSAFITDFISAWDGVSTFDAPMTTGAIPAQGVRRQGSRTTVFTPTVGDDVAVNYQGWARTAGGGLNTSYPSGGVNHVGGSPQIRARPIQQHQNLPASLYNLVEAGSNFVVPDREFTTAVDAPLYSEEYDSITLGITQQIGDSIFLDVAGNVGNLDRQGDLMVHRGLVQTFIDINEVLPTGEANPNFLEPYSEARAYPNLRSGHTTNLRAAAAYVLDDTRWGDFQFNLLAGDSRSDEDQDTYRYVLKSHTDPRQWSTYQPVRFRYYYNTDDSRPYDLSDRTWTYIDPVSGNSTTIDGGLVRDPTQTQNQRAQTNFTYLQAAANAKLLDGRLNLLAAVRSDRYETATQIAVSQYDNPLDWDGTTLYLKPNAPDDWTSLTYRQRDADGNPFGADVPAETRPRSGGVADPRYASDRFQDDYNTPSVKGTINTMSAGSVYHLTPKLSAFVNYAESFVPPIARYNIFGNLLPARSAEGWDYGLRSNLLEGKLVASLTRYTGQDKGNIVSAAAYRSSINTIAQANPVDDLTQGGINSRGLAIPPTSTLDIIQSDVSGWEFELTANMNRNWRVNLNGALAEGYQVGTFPFIQAYMEANDALLRQVVEDAGGVFSGNMATFDSSISADRSPEGPGAVDAYNSIQSSLATISADKQELYRLVSATANVFTDYTFRSGPLNGLRVGAGLNYRGKEAIGYKGADTIVDPANPARTIDDPSVDATDVLYQPGYTTVMLTFNYGFELSKDRKLDLSLRVQNLFDYDKPLHYNSIMRPRDGDLTSPARVATPMSYRWITPRNYTLTATVRF